MDRVCVGHGESDGGVCQTRLGVLCVLGGAVGRAGRRKVSLRSGQWYVSLSEAAPG